MINFIEQITIDPRCKINYASYYIHGFNQLVGKKKIFFNIEPFKEISYKNRKDYNSGMLLIVYYNNNKQKKIFIDFFDNSEIYEDKYNWCDVYCKINIPLINVPVKYENKLFAIGPSFSISLWSWPNLMLNCLRNYIKSKKYYQLNKKQFFLDYLYLNVRRLKYSSYSVTSINSKMDYCFHLSTLWADRQTEETTNYFRGIFLKECRKIYSLFEGGFFYIPSKKAIKIYSSFQKFEERYREFLIYNRISAKKYVKKTKLSAIVFNTPAVAGCHGWKLAEYLAFGKAIISTPLSNQMPGEFMPGIHYHLARNEEEIREAIKLLHDNNEYRLKLEKGAHNYFNEYLSPEKVTLRILKRTEKALVSG